MPKKQLPVAAYVRVSTKSQNAASQRHAIEKAAKARDHVVKWWFSEVKSGAGKRLELERLKLEARAGKFKAVWVYRLDRFSRAGIRDTFATLEQLEQLGVTVHTVADNFDLYGPARDVVVAVLAWAAQMERSFIGERIADAKARIVARGGTWGRPSRVGPALAAKIRAAQKNEGLTHRQLAIAFKVPRSTVGNILARKGAYSRKVTPKTRK